MKIRMLDNRNSVIKTVNIFYRTILYPSVSEVANVLTNCGAVAEQNYPSNPPYSETLLGTRTLTLLYSISHEPR